MAQQIKRPLSSVLCLINSSNSQPTLQHIESKKGFHTATCHNQLLSAPLHMSETQGGCDRGWQEIRLRHHTPKLNHRRSCHITKETYLPHWQAGDVNLILRSHYCHHAVNKTGGDITTVTSLHQK